MATIVHFDVSAECPETAKKFYEQLFGWKVELMPGAENFYLVQTHDRHGANSMCGGIHKRKADQHPGITNFFGVESIDSSIEKVIELGGTILTTKQEVPGFGHLAVCMDTEDNCFGLFQENHGFQKSVAV